MKTTNKVLTIFLMLLMSLSVFASNAAAAGPDQTVLIEEFHSSFFLGKSYPGTHDTTSYYSFDLVIVIYNPADLAGPDHADRSIPGLYDIDGTLFVDVRVTDGSGNVYSINQEERKLQLYWNDPNNDYLTLYYSTRVLQETELPIGIFTANIVRLSDEAVLDTASFNTYYTDASGDFTLPPPKIPIQLYPEPGSTIQDATPTFTWQYPAYPYEGESFYLRASTWWVSEIGQYVWGISQSNPVIKPVAMTFPNAPEFSSDQIFTIVPSGQTIPAELPTGTLVWDVFVQEYFSSQQIKGDPRCYFMVGYSNACNYVVERKWTVRITPQSLNLASNGKWITGQIEVPEGYNVNDIDASSIRLNGVVPIDASFVPKVGDSDSNGAADLTVKFDRAIVASLLKNAADVGQDTGKFSTAELSVSGSVAGKLFTGFCTIKVIRK